MAALSVCIISRSWQGLIGPLLIGFGLASAGWPIGADKSSADRWDESSASVMATLGAFMAALLVFVAWMRR